MNYLSGVEEGRSGASAVPCSSTCVEMLAAGLTVM